MGNISLKLFEHTTLFSEGNHSQYYADFFYLDLGPSMFIGSESRPIILDLYREKTQIRLRIYNTDTGKLLGNHHYINFLFLLI